MDNLFNKEWWKHAGIRAIRTVCQTAVALIGSGATGILDVDWLNIISVSFMAGVVSILTSIAGLPEVSDEEDIDEEDEEDEE